ncbi:MAG TPA: PP0621 family protein [Burkholderiales bacterium]|nr:PP0621 family protein [Burkholderiales bacterium]
MSRLLLVIIGALLVYWVLRSYRKGLLKSQQHRDATGEDMVRCAHCGVNLPKSESFTSHGDYFCSQEHQRAHPNKK